MRQLFSIQNTILLCNRTYNFILNISNLLMLKIKFNVHPVFHGGG